MNKLLALFFLTLTTLILSGCNTSKDKEIEALLSWDANTLYNTGLNEARLGKLDAVKKFDALEQAYPADPRIPESYVLKAYIYYLDDKFDESIATIDEFSERYPRSESLSYMKYLKGLCYYTQIIDVGRDQEITQKSLAAFDEVIKEFPDTDYATNAKGKRGYALSVLAGKEMDIGRFYMKRKNMIAAITRFKTVIDIYDTTLFVPEALYRLSECYLALGIFTQAETYEAVLAHNFPDSNWHKKSYMDIQRAKMSSKVDVLTTPLPSKTAPYRAP